MRPTASRARVVLPKRGWLGPGGARSVAGAGFVGASVAEPVNQGVERGDEPGNEQAANDGAADAAVANHVQPDPAQGPQDQERPAGELAGP